jgi:hypothetical protein
VIGPCNVCCWPRKIGRTSPGGALWIVVISFVPPGLPAASFRPETGHSGRVRS